MILYGLLMNEVGLLPEVNIRFTDTMVMEMRSEGGTGEEHST